MVRPHPRIPITEGATEKFQDVRHYLTRTIYPFLEPVRRGLRGGSHDDAYIVPGQPNEPADLAVWRGAASSDGLSECSTRPVGAVG